MLAASSSVSSFPSSASKLIKPFSVKKAKVLFEFGTSWNNLTVPIGQVSLFDALNTSTSLGWQIDYDCVQPDPAGQPNVWFYTIVIY
jgi:hypothetical protein